MKIKQDMINGIQIIHQAINKSNAEVVYISLVNSKHYKYALKALNKNKNVIIDKPILFKD